MFPFVRFPVALIVLGAVLASGAFLVARDRTPADTFFRHYELFYLKASVDTSAGSATTPSLTATTSVPILVYHIVRPSYPTDSKAVRALAQTPEVFDAQMKHLADAGYRVIPLRDLEDHFEKGTPLPPKSVIISFDDGWSDQFTYAFPVLKKYGYTATFFVFTNPIGTRGFITWDQLRTLRDAGMTIGSHSLSHPFLTKIALPSALRSEIYDSKKVLEKNLGITVREFAYPFGQYNANIAALVKDAGYASARGDYYHGPEQHPDRLYRLSAMNAPTTTELFARKFPAN